MYTFFLKSVYLNFAKISNNCNSSLSRRQTNQLYKYTNGTYGIKSYNQLDENEEKRNAGFAGLSRRQRKIIQLT